MPRRGRSYHSRSVSDAERAGSDARAATARASCDPEELNMLAVDSWSHVRAAAAANPATPEQGLLRCARDQHPAPRAAVTENPQASPAVLIAFLRNRYVDATESLLALRNPNVDADVLRVAAARRTTAIAEAVLMHSACPPDLVARYARSSVPAIKAVAALRKYPEPTVAQVRRLCPQGLERLLRTHTWYREQQIVLTEPWMRALEAARDSFDVPAMVLLAAHPLTSAATANALAGHPEVGVRRAVANRADLDEAAYLRLAVDEDRYVRDAVRNNDACPESAQVAGALLR